MNLGYSYTVDKAVLESLIGLRKTDRDRLLRTFAELTDNPFLDGDFARSSPEQPDLQVKRFGRWMVTWWVDHPVKKVRVAGVDLISLPRD